LKERLYGHPVQPDELFMATHTNKKCVWVDTRTCKTYVSLFLQIFLHCLYFYCNFLTFQCPNDCVRNLPRALEGHTAKEEDTPCR